MKIWGFTIHLSGEGETEEEAWADAVEGFSLDPGIAEPSDFVEELEDNE